MKTPYSVGIRLNAHPTLGWAARVEFSTLEFAKAPCINGEIRTQYFVGDLATAIDQIMDASREVGVVFLEDAERGLEPYLFVEGDGEDPEVWLPENWRDIVSQQSERIGWRPFYRTDSVGAHHAPEQPTAMRP